MMECDMTWYSNVCSWTLSDMTNRILITVKSQTEYLPWYLTVSECHKQATNTCSQFQCDTIQQ